VKKSQLKKWSIFQGSSRSLHIGLFEQEIVRWGTFENTSKPVGHFFQIFVAFSGYMNFMTHNLRNREDKCLKVRILYLNFVRKFLPSAQTILEISDLLMKTTKIIWAVWDSRIMCYLGQHPKVGILLFEMYYQFRIYSTSTENNIKNTYCISSYVTFGLWMKGPEKSNHVSYLRKYLMQSSGI
jgi:hypothetical protein